MGAGSQECPGQGGLGDEDVRQGRRPHLSSEDMGGDHLTKET